MLFATIWVLLVHLDIGPKNQKPSYKLLPGYVSYYCSIKSFDSVMVSLFWSFANSNTSLKMVKAG